MGVGGWEVWGGYGMKQRRGRRNRRASIIFHHHQGEGISGGKGSRRYYEVWGMRGLDCYTCMSCFFFLFPASSPYPPNPPETLPHAHLDGGGGGLHKLVCFFSVSSLHHPIPPPPEHLSHPHPGGGGLHILVCFFVPLVCFTRLPHDYPPP